MVNENLVNLTINKKPFELVQELKDYEIKKSPLSVAARAKVIKKYGGNYQSSRMDSEDIALMEMYGPGFWEGVWDVTKKVGGFALAVSYATPVAPFTMAGTLAVVGTGMAMEESGNDTLKKVAGEIKDVFRATDATMDIGGEAGKTYNNYRSVTRK